MSLGPNCPVLLVLDCDGVLTDGRLPFDDRGPSGKAFHVQDGFALGVWRRAGGKVAIVSGRRSEAVEKRAAELSLDHLFQGISDKLQGLSDTCAALGLSPGDCCYVGDDWPDIPAMKAAALSVAVANAAPAVKRAARWVTRRSGGDAAVAEIVEWLLRRADRWPPA